MSEEPTSLEELSVECPTPTVSVHAGEEEAVGIMAFANKELKRFSGMVKKRYSDFVVDEIDLTGRVAQFTEVMYEDSTKPPEAKEEVSDDNTAKLAVFERELGELLEKVNVDAVMGLLDGASEEPVLSASIAEKSDRTKVHSAVRVAFGGTLVTDTVEDAVRILLKDNSMSGQDRKRARLDKRNFQDPHRLPCVRFVVRKEYMETLEAVQLIAKRAGINSKDLNTAGTKDKRGVTTQFVTARHVNPKRLAAADGMAGGRLRISNLEAWPEALRLGDLQGNRFTLVLRQIDGGEDEIRAAIDSLSVKGFVNYYGLQRFGSMCVKSHDIGQALLQGEWERAIALILDPRADEPDGLARQARRVWSETGDASAAHHLFPFRYNAERQVLQHFAKQGGQSDRQGAIMSISRELRLMFVHSVQSLLWNRLVTERIRRFGMEPVAGDLVIGPDTPPTALTEEDITSARYNIFDVAMPVPGYEVKAPEGPIGELYREIVGSLIDMEAFRPKTKGLWDLPGAYRHMLTLPKDVQCTLGYYDEPEAVITGAAEDLKAEGKFGAVRIAFSLPSSAYATMALREIMVTQR